MILVQHLGSAAASMKESPGGTIVNELSIGSRDEFDHHGAELYPGWNGVLYWVEWCFIVALSVL